jgi:hypothetical protein
MNKFMYALLLMLLARPIISAQQTQCMPRRQRICCDLRSYVPSMRAPSYTQTKETLKNVLWCGVKGGVVLFYGSMVDAVLFAHYVDQYDGSEMLFHPADAQACYSFSDCAINRFNARWPSYALVGSLLGALYGAKTAKNNYKKNILLG